mmetsp:Transcript_9281/g.17747  ORF Transcript_9281/g.17747 Transcript_9281/m.17747 type:complete len:205 (-) Transcript_9281:819-1433(-)
MPEMLRAPCVSVASPSSSSPREAAAASSAEGARDRLERKDRRQHRLCLLRSLRSLRSLHSLRALRTLRGVLLPLPLPRLSQNDAVLGGLNDTPDQRSWYGGAKVVVVVSSVVRSYVRRGREVAFLCNGSFLRLGSVFLLRANCDGTLERWLTTRAIDRIIDLLAHRLFALGVEVQLDLRDRDVLANRLVGLLLLLLLLLNLRWR